MTPGQALAAKRAERGLSIDQVAASTRIRPAHLRALEADEFDGFSAPVYAKGYLRTYATYLGLDAEDLIRRMPRDLQQPGLALGLDKPEHKPRVLLTTPAVGAAGLVLVAGAFTGYIWREVTVDQRSAASLSSSPASQESAVPGTPSASPAIQARPIVVGVRVTESVWINATVDGTPQYGDSGRTLPAGSIVYFTGLDVKITSGKSSITFITIDGHDLGPMGVGVTTREFSSQTSP